MTRTAFFAFILGASTASALSIADLRKLSSTQQADYLAGAVSMMAYTYASNGDVAKARCIQTWYFGRDGAPAPGVRSLMLEIAVAEQQDPDRLHVEGVILGLGDKHCGQPKKP